eukprot:685987-Alexandrium_andersonii.AAC.1
MASARNACVALRLIFRVGDAISRALAQPSARNFLFTPRGARMKGSRGVQEFSKLETLKT